MKSTHTWQSVPASELIKNGAIIERVKDDLFSVGFPARGDVGPIHGTWYSEPQDMETLQALFVN